MKININAADESDIEKIIPYIEEYQLDNENLVTHEFYIVKINDKIAGFGRFKQYDDIFEIASIGVLESYRGFGIGKKLLNKIISAIPSLEIWIATVIPEYFKQFGFTEDDNIPDAILFKSQRVCSRLYKTTEKIAYMKFTKNKF